MSIQKKEYESKKTGKTVKKYYACVYDTRTEKPVWSKGFSTEREAKKEEARMIQEQEKHSIAEKKILFSQAAEEYLAGSKAKYAKSTHKTYVSYYKRYIKPVFGDREIHTITTRHMQLFFNEICEKYAPATANKIKNLTSLIFQYAENIMECNVSNPCTKIGSARIAKPFHETWTKEQISYFLNLDIVKESVYYELLLLSALTGARPEEICGIQENALSIDNTLFLDRAYDRDGNITDMKTSNSHRCLKLPESIADKLRIRLSLKNIWRKNPDFQESDFLFCREDGSLISPLILSRNFRNMVRRNNAYAGERPDFQMLPVIRLYDLRHSLATNLIMDETIPDKIVSEIIGTSVKTLLYHYSHVRNGIQGDTLAEYAASIL